MASLGPDLRLQFVLHLHNNAQEQLFTVPFQDSLFHLPQTFPRERRREMPTEGDQLVRNVLLETIGFPALVRSLLSLEPQELFWATLLSSSCLPVNTWSWAWQDQGKLWSWAGCCITWNQSQLLFRLGRRIDERLPGWHRELKISLENLVRFCFHHRWKINEESGLGVGRIGRIFTQL